MPTSTLPSLFGKTTHGALLGSALVLLGASGCGTSAADLCEAVCDCEGCSDAQLDDCVDELEEIEERASDAGCEDEMDDWMSCVDSELECSGDDTRIDGCDDEERELTRCGDASLSSGSVCDLAVSLCGSTPGGIECSGVTECFSACLVAAGNCESETIGTCSNSCTEG